MRRMLMLSLGMVLLGGLLRTARAEDLVLVDGRYLQVKIQSVNERGIRVRLLRTGGEVWVPWALIREADRDRLKVRFGLKEEEVEITVKGVRLTTTKGAVYEGVPQGEVTPGQVPDAGITLRHEGADLPFPKKVIREIEWTEIPALSAYNVSQLYKLKLEELKPADDDLSGHWDMAQLSSSMGAFAEAIMHYKKVQDLDPLYRADYVGNQLVRLEEQAKNARREQAIKKARRLASFHRYDKSTEILQQVLDLGDELGPNLKQRVEQTLGYVLKKRWDYFSKKVVRRYYLRLDREVKAIAGNKKLKLREAQREVKRDLHKRILTEIATRFGLDQKSEVKKMWDERKSVIVRTATYGSGSFVVLGEAKGARQLQQQLEQAIRQAMGGNRGGRGGRGGQQGGGFSAQMRLPKPPTKDEWWDRASSSERALFLKAYFAEFGGSLKVVSERWYECGRCGGQGTLKFAGASGGDIQVTCPRCHGHKRDKGLGFN